MNAECPAVGLIVFNRPEHTREVLRGLERNGIDHLYVFADGPPTDDDRDAIESTRDVVREVEFCDVDLVAREENYGVRRSWIAAYEYLFERHESAILLEDDCVPASDFVQYMAACLDEYADDERVMNIHGYCPPISIPDSYPYDVFFTWRSGSWGQATWRDAWAKFEMGPTILERIGSDSELRRRVKRAGWDLLPMLRKEVAGEIDSVGVWWSLTLVRQDGVSVNPVRSRVRNIGHDGSGSHSTKTDRFLTEINEDAPLGSMTFPPAVDVEARLNRRYNDYIGGGIRGRIGRALESLTYRLPF